MLLTDPKPLNGGIHAYTFKGLLKKTIHLLPEVFCFGHSAGTDIMLLDNCSEGAESSHYSALVIKRRSSVMFEDQVEQWSKGIVNYLCK